MTEITNRTAGYETRASFFSLRETEKYIEKLPSTKMSQPKNRDICSYFLGVGKQNNKCESSKRLFLVRF